MTNVAVNTVGDREVNNANRVVVRTSGNRVYVFTTNSAILEAFKGNQDGEPTSFSSVDTVLSQLFLVEGIAAAIDSNNVVHLCYLRHGSGMSDIKQVLYRQFNTSTDQFTSSEVIAELDFSGTIEDRQSIAIDANDDPHVMWRDSFKDMGVTTFSNYYSNRAAGVTSGVWDKARLDVANDTNDNDGKITDIMIADPASSENTDLPIVAGSGSTLQIDAYFGNVLDATSFTQESNIAAGTSFTGGIQNISMAIDSNEKITIVFQQNSTNDLYIVEHLNSNAWSSWETPVEVASDRNYTHPTLTIDGTKRFIIVVFVEGADLILFKNKTGTTWTEENICDPDLPNIGTFDEPKVKWASKNNNTPTQADYVFGDNSNDIIYNKFSTIVECITHTTDSFLKSIVQTITHTADGVIGAPHLINVKASATMHGRNNIIRTQSGVLYCAVSTDVILQSELQNFVELKIEMRKSTDNGVSWSNPLDAANQPDDTDVIQPSIDLDSNGLIHLAYFHLIPSSGSLQYTTFNTSTDTWGTDTNIEVLNNDGDNDLFSLSLAVDLNDDVHIAFVERNGTSDIELKYTNNVAGGGSTFKTPVLLEVDISNVKPRLIFDEDDFPTIICNNDNINDVFCFLGNAINATSFTTFVIDSAGTTIDNVAHGIAKRRNGDMLAGFISSGSDLEVRRHASGSAPGTWDAIHVVDAIVNWSGVQVYAIGDVWYLIAENISPTPNQLVLIRVSGSGTLTSTVLFSGETLDHISQDKMREDTTSFAMGWSEHAQNYGFPPQIDVTHRRQLPVTASNQQELTYHIFVDGDNLPVKAHETDAFLAVAESPAVTEDHTTDTFLKRAVAHSTDAFLRRAIAHTTDAFLIRALSHTTDAFLRIALAHSTDAFLRRAIAHTTDALLLAHQEVTHTTDALLLAHQTLTHNTDAILVQKILVTHTTDATLLGHLEITHSTDAILEAHQVLTHTTDAFLRRALAHTTNSFLIRAIAHSTDAFLKRAIAHSTDALLQAHFELTHTTDSFLRRAIAHSTDAFLRRAIAHSTDAFIISASQLTHTTDALLKKLDNLLTHTTDSFLKRAIAHSTDAFLRRAIAHTTDALLLAHQTITHTTDATLKKLGLLRTHSTDALLLAHQTLTHTTDAILLAHQTITHTTDALLKKLDNLLTHTTDAILLSFETRVHTTDAFLKRAIAHSTDAFLKRAIAHTTDAFLQGMFNLTHTTDAILKKFDLIRTHTTDAILQTTQTLTHTTNALLQAIQTLTHTTDAFLLTHQTLTHTTDSFLKKVIAHSTDAFLLGLKEERTHTTDATLLKHISLTHTTDSFLVPILEHTTDAYLAFIRERTHTVDALLQAHFTRTHSTDAILADLEVVVTHSTDAILGDMFAKIHTTDAILEGHIEVTHDTDAYLAFIRTLTHTTDRFLAAPVQKTITHTTDAFLRSISQTRIHQTDAYLADPGTVSLHHFTDAILNDFIFHSTDAVLVIQNIPFPTHTTDAILKTIVFLHHNTSAILFKFAIELTHTTDSILISIKTLTHSTDSYIQNPALIHTTDAFLLGPFTLFHTTDSILGQFEGQRTHTTDSSIQLKGLTLTHTSDALLQTLNILTHTTDAFKLKKASLTHNTDGYLQLVVEPSHTTDAALQKFDLDITHKTDAYLGVVIRITHTTDSIIQEMQNLRTHSTDAILTGSFSGAFAQVVLKREDRKTVTFSRIKKSTVVFAREKQNVGVIQ